MPIHFYLAGDAYGCFSNFSRHKVSIYGMTCKTSEHTFQAMKFWPHQDLVRWVQSKPTPGQAAHAGRDRRHPIRADWDATPPEELANRISNAFYQFKDEDEVWRDLPPEPLFARTKDVFMYEIVLAKFTQHTGCRQTLLGTGDVGLVEHTSADPYWADGPSLTGHNKLGRILMLVRQELRGKP